MPYAPGTEDRSADYLFHGISGAGAALGGGIANFMERRKREADDTKRARQMLKIIGDDAGVDATDIENMSGPEAKATLDAVQFKQSTIGQNLMNQLHAKELELKKSQMLLMSQRQEQAPGYMSRMAELMQGRPGPMAQPPMSGPQAMLMAAGEYPAFAPGPNDMDTFMRMVRESGQQFAFDPTRDVVSLPQLPGQFFVRTSTGGGQIGQTPESIGAATKAREEQRTTSQKELIKERQEVKPKVKAVYDPLTEEMRYEGDPEEVEAFVRSRKGGTAPAAAGAKGLPLPKSKAELKRGQRYETARGIAVWDGEKFVQEAPPAE
jgi:hypothetical protein